MALVAGRYEIVRALGRGGMGEVVLARQLNLNRLVVIKRVPPDQSARHVEALLDEAQVAARLHHPNIVNVLDVSGDDERPFVAMEYVAGVTLREMLERAPGGLPPDIALVITLDVLRGLAYAHGVKSGVHTGVVHRDIKPRNIMVTFAGPTKLIDFGISRWLANDGGWEATSVSGTHGYMAPEQQRGTRADGRADQYSVGVVLREMLTGGEPGGEETVKRPPPPVTDPELAAILERACAESPDDRFTDCDAMIVALERHAVTRGLTLSATHVERWMRDHLDDRIEAWERDAERASEPEMLPSATAPTMPAFGERRVEPVSTVVSGERVAPPVVAPVRRWRWLAALAAAGVVVGAMVALVTSRHEQPLRRVAIVAHNAGSADDDWLAPAVEHVARHALRDVAARGYWLVAPGDARATLHVAIDVRHGADGIHLDARDGTAVLAQADAPSVVEAVELLTAPLALAIAEGHSAAGPDEHEAAEQAALGANSFEEYRRYRALVESARTAGWIDSPTVAARYEELVKSDPAWAHPYAELYWLYGSNTQATKDLLARARAAGDRTRDPGGFAILDALELLSQSHEAQALKLAEPVFERDNTDIIAAETVVGALDGLHGDDQERAIHRRLQELYPDLEYASNVSADLASEDRDDEAERIVRESLAANPENLTSGREVVRFAIQHGDDAEAARTARRMLLVHGEQPIALTELYEVMILSNDFTEAQRLVDRMLLGSPLSRARARYRTAVIAVFEGRLGAAYQLARAALAEFLPFGLEGELTQCLELIRALAPLVVTPDEVTAATAALANEFAHEADPAIAAVYRYRVALAGPTCPKLDDFLADLDPTYHGAARRDMLRFGALGNCASYKDAVAAGLSPREINTDSLVAFGRCADHEHDLPLARRSFELAARLWSSVWSRQASPYHAVLARYYLAGVLAELGDRAGARAQYERFLHAWQHGDREVPEVALAVRALAALITVFDKPSP